MTDAEETELEFDWGGDGSDRHKTVRAHVEAALVPTDGAYPPPLDQLLTLGNPLEQDDTESRIEQNQTHTDDRADAKHFPIEIAADYALCEC